MASIYRRGDRPNSPYRVSFTDHAGRRRVMCPKGKKKRDAEGLKNQIVDDLDLVRRRLMRPQDTVYERDAKREAKSLTDHVQDYRDFLVNKGDVEKHANGTKHHLTRIVELTGAERIEDLTLSKAQEAIKAMREQDLSVSTCNHAVRALRAFATWLCKEGRARENRLCGLTVGKVETDRRHERRSLTDDEFARLLTAARNGPTLYGMSGEDRRVLYLTAGGTGFRRGEIQSLRLDNFHLHGAHPTIHLDAANTKNGQAVDQPIKLDLAAEPRAWLKGRPADAPVLPVPKYSALMIRRDLEAAGVPYEDDRGRVADFHAVRNFYVTTLFRSGLTVIQVQKLARHSTPTPTANTYTDLKLHDLASTVQKLPGIPSDTSEPTQQKATGTDDTTADSRVAHWQRAASTGCESMRQRGDGKATAKSRRSAKKARLSGGKTGKWERVDLNHRRLSRQIYSLSSRKRKSFVGRTYGLVRPKAQRKAQRATPKSRPRKLTRASPN